jgi:hypothetical protein
MLQRKQAAQQFQEGQAQSAALHGIAQQQAVTQLNAAHDAQNFQARTAIHLDPATGQAAHFFQKEPGKWEQMDFGNTPQANQPVGQTAADDASQERLPETPDEQTERPPAQPVFTQAQVAAGARMRPDGTVMYPPAGYHPEAMDQYRQGIQPNPDGTLPEPGQQAAPPGGPGSMSVQQGPYTEQYQDGRLVSTDRPTPQQAAPGSLSGFSPEDVQHAKNVADGVTFGMAPGLHRDVAHANAMRQVLTAAAHRTEADRRTTALTQQQQARATASERAKATAAQEQERKESRQNAFKVVDEEYRSHVASKAKDANYAIPSLYSTPDARLAEAQRIHREGWAATHPDSQEAKAIATGKSQAAATEPSEMDKIAALGKVAETHYNTPGEQGFFYNSADANTAKSMVDVLGKAFSENRPLTSAEKQQYDTLQKKIINPQLRERLDWNGKFAQQAKGTAGAVQRGPSGAPVIKDPVIARKTAEPERHAAGVGGTDQRPTVVRRAGGLPERTDAADV